MHHCDDDKPVCRGCGRGLQGSPYFKGGQAYIPADNPRHEYDRKPAKVNYYGGWVCSRSCDIRAARELENSMPGHGYDPNSRLSQGAQSRIQSNWGE